MTLSTKRNLWIIIGLIILFLFQITIFIPYLNIPLALFCFYKAYSLHKELTTAKEN